MTNHFDNSRPTILCGFAALGKEIFFANMKINQVNIIGVLDNDETKLVGTPESWCWENLTQDMLSETNFVICAIRQQARTELRQQLESLGAKHTYHATDLLRAYPNLVTLAKPGTGREDREDALSTRKLYADEASKRVVESIVRSWMFPEDTEGPEPAELISDIADIYFPDFIKALPHEVFVDVGAFDGDTLDQFVAWNGRATQSKAIAIEASYLNFEKLKAKWSRVPAVSLVRAAVSDKDYGDALWWEEGVASHEDRRTLEDCDPKIRAPMRSLDSILKDEGMVTFIKADIEGCELTMLEGAGETIRRFMPILAVVCYHHPKDLSELPRFIHKIAPGYKLFLRKYAPDFYESVLYAVPSDRVDWEKVEA